MQLFPHNALLRIIGRLALPIFAYMIAEGCRYTRNRKKYLVTVLLCGLVCQVVYFVAMGSLYQCILITFSLSIVLIYCLDAARSRSARRDWLLLLLALCAVYFLSAVLPRLLPGTDYAIDYGFFGILLPVCFYLGPTRKHSLLFGALGMALLALDSGFTQWFSFAAMSLLLLYNGQRGKRKLKYLFYIYYPVHLAVIWLISLVI